MNADEVLNMLEVQCDGVLRDGPNGLTFFLRIVNDIFGKTPSEQHVVFDESTGKLPTFDTKSGDYKYEAPSNIWRVAGVMVESDATLGSCVSRQDYGYSSSRNASAKTERIVIANISYIRIPYIRSHDAEENANAWVLFTTNPGDTTGLYRWYGYNLPTPVLSDSIQLCESSDSYVWAYIFPAVTKMVQAFKNGDFLAAHADIEVLADKYRREKNKGEQGEDSDAIDYGF